MRLYEELERIVREETESCSSVLQMKALNAFQEWFDLSGETESRFCRKIRDRIKTTFQKRDRGAARQVLNSISQRFAIQSLVDAKRLQTDRRYVAETTRENALALNHKRRQGGGSLFLGTARSKPGEVEYERAQELAREVACLCPESTIWSGAGPGDMDATIRGAKEVGSAVGGVKIHLTEEQSAFEQNISDAFDPDEVVECQYFHPRKVGLAHAATREGAEERTAVFCLPGGFGSMDEFFEFLTLMQLKIIGKDYPIPIYLMNYDGEYDGIIAFADRALQDKRISKADHQLIRICTSNKEALDNFADFYEISEERRTYAARLRNWSEQKNTT